MISPTDLKSLAFQADGIEPNWMQFLNLDLNKFVRINGEVLREEDFKLKIHQT